MGPTDVFIIIICVCSFCFLLFQLWYVFENYEYIKDYILNYKHLQFAQNPNLKFIDKTIYDPNEDEKDKDSKFRCVSDDNKTYYFVNKNGFSGNDNGVSTWDNIDNCLLIGFGSLPIINIKTPTQGSELYNLLQKLMNKNK